MICSLHFILFLYELSNEVLKIIFTSLNKCALAGHVGKDPNSLHTIIEKSCIAFVGHVGKDPNSLHKIIVKSCKNLINGSQHIEKLIENILLKKLQRIN